MAISEGTTVVGESMVVSGNLSGDEDLTVRGRVEGTVTLTKALLIEATGVVKAEVQVKSCVVSGAVMGNITASESVEITREGRMVGDISAPRVVIVDGATFRGRIDMGEVDVEHAGERPALARASTRPTFRPPPRATPALPRAEGEERGEEEEGKAALAERAAGAVKPPPPPVPVAMGAVKRKVIVRRK